MPAPRRLGRYELVTELGRGGMAELHLGRLLGPAGFAKPLALKLILPHLSDEKQFVDMFLKEGRIAARMSHPNVCQVFELGEAEGRLFLAMEYLEGVSWDELVKHLPDDEREAARASCGMVVQAAAGLGYAHELADPDGTATPVIHRDVSPQNLFVTRDGICKVLDFGVSKIVGDRARTRSGVVKGKLPYMPPEQLAAADIDARTDVFALGVVLWEALTGERLFDRDTDFLVYKAITEEDVAAPSTKVAGLPAELDAVVLRALSRDAAGRYASMSEFATALTQAMAAHGGVMSTAELAKLVASTCGPQLASRAKLVATAVQQSPPTAVTVASDPGATASMELRSESVLLGTPRRRWPALAALGAAVLVVAVAVFALTRPTESPERQVASLPGSAARAPLDAAAAEGLVADAAAVAIAPDAGTGSRKPNKPREGTAVRETPRPDASVAQVPPMIRDAGPVATVPAGPGKLSIDVKPSAKVYLDGTYLDDTPIYRREVPAGKHTLRVVRADRAEKTMPIEIEPGKLLNLTTLAW